MTDTAALAGAEVADSTVTNPTGKYIGASLILEGTMKLRFYFKGNDVEATVDGKAAEVVNGKNYCYVDVEVTPDNIDTFFEVAAGDVTVEYSALNYLKNTVSNPDKADLHEMVASIYAYSVEAEEYIYPATYEYPMNQVTPLDATVSYGAGNETHYFWPYNGYESALIRIPDSKYKTVSMTIRENHPDPWLCWAFVSEYPTLNQPVPYAEGYTTMRFSWDMDCTVDIPADAKYLLIYYSDGETNYCPDSITFHSGRSTLDYLQDETLDEYVYPLESLMPSQAAIAYEYAGSKHLFLKGIGLTKDEATLEGKGAEYSKRIDHAVAFIDVTDCAFSTVKLDVANAWIGWAFLTEMPEIGEAASYAPGYSTIKWNDENQDAEFSIPKEAKYLVIWYMDNYDAFYYPEKITFKK